QAHAVLTQPGRQPDQCLFATQLGADDGMVDDVVAVCRARTRARDRRQVVMADTQARIIRRLPAGIHQGETGMQLQAGGGARRVHAAPCSPPICTLDAPGAIVTTEQPASSVPCRKASSALSRLAKTIISLLGIFVCR